MTNKEIYQKAIEKWGKDSQIDMAIEECAELIVSLKHLKRGRVSMDDVRSEIADVEIMTEQLRIIFGSRSVDIHKIAKIDRLRERVLE